jgi:hypothetical protein
MDPHRASRICQADSCAVAGPIGSARRLFHMCARSARLIFMLLLFTPALANAAPIVWSESMEIAAGPAERGPWRQNESEYDYVDDPTVAITAAGDVFVAWVDQARKDMFLTRVPAGASTPDKPVNVSRTPATFSWLPRIALHPKDSRQVFLLWQEIIFSGGSHGGDILYARSTDHATTFSDPVNLSRSVGGDGKGRINLDVWDNGSLDIAASARGEVYAVWTEYDGPLWFARSEDGETFLRPVQLAGRRGAKPARGPSIAVRDAKVYVAWTVGETASADIHLAISTDGGRAFSEPQRIATSPTYSDAPALAADDRGIVHLAFAESAGGPFEPDHVRYTQSRDGGRTFASARTISSPLPAGAVAASSPALETDESGTIYALFELHADARDQPRGLALSISRNGGRNFSPPMLVSASRDSAGGANGSQQGSLMSKLAVNANGDIAVANSSFKARQRSRVWLVRGLQPSGEHSVQP